MAKYYLTRLIKSLTKEEIRSFKLYADRVNYGGQSKKIIHLFDKIKKDEIDEFSDELANEFFPNGNKNAYYRLKNRLIEEIEYSLLMLNRAKDDYFKVCNYIQLARIFDYKSEYEKALEYLHKAEKLAMKTNYDHVLSLIYDELLTLSVKYDKVNPEQYVEKKKQYKQKYLYKEQYNMLLATVKYKFRDTNFSEENNDVLPLLEGIIQDLSLTKTLDDDPSIQFKLHECIREVLLQKRDFVTLEYFLIDNFNEFEAKNMFTKLNYERKLMMFSWIINTCIKNKKFEKSLIYTKQLHDALLNYNKLYYERYIWLYHQSQVINYSFLGKNKDALSILEGLRENAKLNEGNFYKIFVYLNLATIYYCEGDLDKGLENLSKLIRHDVFKNFAVNWKISIALVELVLRVELADYTYADYRLKEVKRLYKKELKKKQYHREEQFMDILKDIIRKPGAFKSPKIKTHIEQFISNSPTFEPGSNEAINYQTWLQAKLEGRDYYELILEKVNKQPSAVVQSKNRRE